MNCISSHSKWALWDTTCWTHWLNWSASSNRDEPPVRTRSNSISSILAVEGKLKSSSFKRSIIVWSCSVTFEIGIDCMQLETLTDVFYEKEKWKTTQTGYGLWQNLIMIDQIVRITLLVLTKLISTWWSWFDAMIISIKCWLFDRLLYSSQSIGATATDWYWFRMSSSSGVRMGKNGYEAAALKSSLYLSCVWERSKKRRLSDVGKLVAHSPIHGDIEVSINVQSFIEPQCLNYTAVLRARL